MVIILHNIRSLHNVGSIFRTADGAGVQKVYLCGITPSPIDQFGEKRPQLSKVSLGAEDSLDWESNKSTIRLIKKLRTKGFRILALEQDKKSIPYSEIKLSKKELAKTALILGTEVTGLEKKILDQVDQILEIPMLGKKESLNVSVAFGIAVYALTKAS